MSLTDLLSRLEEATGPLECSIEDLVSWEQALGLDNGLALISRALAGSLDSSLALVERVLPGWVVGLDQQAPDHWEAMLSKSSGRFLIEADGEVFGSAKTPAIALLIALIRALGDGAQDASTMSHA